jgi:hypothetical protein
MLGHPLPWSEQTLAEARRFKIEAAEDVVEQAVHLTVKRQERD